MTFHSTAPDPVTIVIFGASGDLTARKLIPALYHLWEGGYLGGGARIIGCARREKTDDSFREELLEAVESSRSQPLKRDSWDKFASQLFYRQFDIAAENAHQQLPRILSELESAAETPPHRLVYLATSPELFVPSVEALGNADLIPHGDDCERLRVVFEKPFGHDLKSAQKLSHDLNQWLVEEQIYRIDHYLGKETVQNILLFRFGNGIFEPLFNRNHVDHVQITVAESQGMERGRGGYYDRSGALRDVLQNHVLQLLCLVSMEPPALFQADEIRNEKMKVLQALSPGDTQDIANWAIAGQYASAAIDGVTVPGYVDEDRVPHDSRRETYVAMDVRIDNWRWAGVPFYLRTGKRLPQRVTEIAVQFKYPPLHLFTTVECEGDICERVETRPNTLIFRIQPKESIALRFSMKRPGMQYQVQPVTMDFEYESTFNTQLPEAYERLLLDVLRGDSTLFTRSDELEAAWQFVTPVLDAWESDGHPDLYRAGSWGPSAADRMLTRAGRRWRTPSAGH